MVVRVVKIVARGRGVEQMRERRTFVDGVGQRLGDVHVKDGGLSMSKIGGCRRRHACMYVCVDEWDGRADIRVTDSIAFIDGWMGCCERAVHLSPSRPCPSAINGTDVTVLVSAASSSSLAEVVAGDPEGTDDRRLDVSPHSEQPLIDPPCRCFLSSFRLRSSL